MTQVNCARSGRSRGRLDRRFPYWFARISRAFAHHLLPHVQSKFGLTLAEYRVLNTLTQLGPASTKDIASDGSLDKALVTRALVELTARGLVKQTVNGKDRRLRVATLTSSGRTLVAKVLPFVTARQQRLEKLLTAEETRVLVKAMKLFSQEADQMVKEEILKRRQGNKKRS
jgi:DNA-binding MarR family transcriptional regulator